MGCAIQEVMVPVAPHLKTSYTLRLALGGLETRCLVNFDFLIAENPQVPWIWLQNLGFCERQAETQLSSQCSFYAQGWVVRMGYFGRACLPAPIHLFIHQVVLEPLLRARPYARC